MNIRNLIAACLLFGFSATALADLEVYKDYDIGKSVYSITTIRIDANMFDVYLEGLNETWVKANRIAKELGQIEDFKIYSSELPQSGDFNLLLFITYKEGSDLEPSKAKYEAFMKEWGEKRQEESKTIAKTYPNVRKITGEYRLREITLK